MSANERTGWRDSGLSQRHRLWGFNCPAVDIDFLMIEYNHSVPAALVEYKNEHANPNWNEKSYQALKNLGDMAHIPSLVAVYADDFSWFKIGAFNKIGADFLGKRKGSILSEIEFVSLLYEIRGTELPNNIKETIQRNTEANL